MFNGSLLISLSGLFVVLAAFCRIPQEDDDKFLEFSKKAEGGPFRASGLSKTFPEVPRVSSVLCGSLESRQGMPLELERVKV